MQVDFLAPTLIFCLHLKFTPIKLCFKKFSEKLGKLHDCVANHFPMFSVRAINFSIWGCTVVLFRDLCISSSWQDWIVRPVCYDPLSGCIYPVFTGY